MNCLENIIGAKITTTGSIEKEHDSTGFTIDRHLNIIYKQRDTGLSIDINNNILENFRPTGLIIDADNVIRKVGNLLFSFP